MGDRIDFSCTATIKNVVNAEVVIVNVVVFIIVPEKRIFFVKN